MNDNNLAIRKIENIENELIDFNVLEKQLQEDLAEQMEELDILKNNAEKIGDPNTLGEVVLNVVWDQVINQIGVVAGEDFITENRGLSLNLRGKAHLQTTENFANGKIAIHNTKIDYQQRYDDWQSNFKRDENGNIIKKYDRIDKSYKEVLANKEYRKPYDKGRKKGSASIHMDETIPVGKLVRDPAANAHLTLEERVKFDQSDINLNPMDASANESKSDHDAIKWLESERNGQKPAERFNIDGEQIRGKYEEANSEYERLKAEGERHSIEACKQSQREEAFRIGGKALRAMAMGLLAALVKDIIKSLVEWLREEKKNFNSFIEKIKEAIRIFFSHIKQHLFVAIDTLSTTIITSIVKPIANLLKKLTFFSSKGTSR